MIRILTGSIGLIYCVSLWIWSVQASEAHGVSLKESLQESVSKGGFAVIVDGSNVISFNQNTPFIPASTIKLATALVALELLGPTHRFQTAFFTDDNHNLYIKGYGDPFLTSEYIDEIAEAIKVQGVLRVSNIILDDTAFALNGAAEGSENSSNPYDAANGALAVNFNALPLLKQHSSISSGEPQTPLLPLMQHVAGSLKQGHHRVNVSSFKQYSALPNHLQYTAELFKAILSSKGIVVDNNFHTGKVAEGARLIYTYFSRKTVSDMVRDCLQYSNNFMANQLYLSSGAVLFGYPATWEKAKKAMIETMTVQFNIDTSMSIISEGSGLSRDNRVTPATIISILEAFKPYASLLPIKNGTYLKSGTLTGVYCYAGYFQAGAGLDPFVILLNQHENTRESVLKELHTFYLTQVSEQVLSTETRK